MEDFSAVPGLLAELSALGLRFHMSRNLYKGSAGETTWSGSANNSKRWIRLGPDPETLEGLLRGLLREWHTPSQYWNMSEAQKREYEGKLPGAKPQGETLGELPEDFFG